MANSEDGRMSFLEHLEELRSRLMRAVLAVMIGFAVCFVYGEELFRILAAPIAKLLPQGTSLVFTGLPDPFFMYLKVAFITSVFLTIPFVLYQLWAFIRPGLYERESKLAAPFIVLATVLFYTGAAFAYFLVFPAAFKFFLSYQTAELQPMISIREYVSLVLLLMLAFAAVFETPIIVVFLGLLGIFNSSQLRKGRRYFIVIAFIIGAILTPTPDPVNQTLMAVPMMLLYELGIRLLILFEKRREREEESLAQAEMEADRASREETQQQAGTEAHEQEPVSQQHEQGAGTTYPEQEEWTTETPAPEEPEEAPDRAPAPAARPAPRPILRKKGLSRRRRDSRPGARLFTMRRKDRGDRRKDR